jgi:hypothetical protein
MGKQTDEKPPNVQRPIKERFEPVMSGENNLELSFDVPAGSEKEIAQSLFKEHPDVAGQTLELAAQSEKLRSMLNEDPKLAEQFKEDPLKVVAQAFPELKIPLPANRALLSEKYRIKFTETVRAQDDATLVLRRTLEYVAASLSNQAAFDADPLGTLRQVNTGQPAAAVDRAARALEDVLGIYRLDRLALEDWVYVSSQRLRRL